MKIAVAQLGARMHYAVPRIFHEAGMLERLFTDSYVGNKPWLEAGLKAVPAAIRPRGVERWLGRREPAIPPEKVTSFEILGLRYARARARARDSLERSHVLAAFAERFNERIIRHGLGDADTVWGFNGAALELFRWAKARGLGCILEQTMAPHRVHHRLMGEERERWPGWQPGLEIPDPEDDPLVAREEEEWRLADLVICGSEFVVEGIRECDGPVAKCRVVPYGVDPGRFRPRAPRPVRRDGRLRVLFAGEVGLRKGAPYLLEALRELGPDKVEARFAGTVVLDPAKLEAYRDVATFPGPVPRWRMPELYAWADVFVLPSVCEGSATVIYEALAAGLPVVCTPYAGPPDHPRLTTIRSCHPLGFAESIVKAAGLRTGVPACPSLSSISLRAYGDALLEAAINAQAAGRTRHARSDTGMVPSSWSN